MLRCFVCVSCIYLSVCECVCVSCICLSVCECVCVCARARVLLLLCPKLIAFLDHMTTVGITGKFHGL